MSLVLSLTRLPRPLFLCNWFHTLCGFNFYAYSFLAPVLRFIYSIASGTITLDILQASDRANHPTLTDALPSSVLSNSSADTTVTWSYKMKTCVALSRAFFPDQSATRCPLPVALAMGSDSPRWARAEASFASRAVFLRYTQPQLPEWSIMKSLTKLLSA